MTTTPVEPGRVLVDDLVLDFRAFVQYVVPQLPEPLRLRVIAETEAGGKIQLRLTVRTDGGVHFHLLLLGVDGAAATLFDAGPQ